jgi:hypothetical protein
MNVRLPSCFRQRDIITKRAKTFVGACLWSSNLRNRKSVRLVINPISEGIGPVISSLLSGNNIVKRNTDDEH